MLSIIIIINSSIATTNSPSFWGKSAGTQLSVRTLEQLKWFTHITQRNSVLTVRKDLSFRNNIRQVQINISEVSSVNDTQSSLILSSNWDRFMGGGGGQKHIRKLELWRINILSQVSIKWGIQSLSAGLGTDQTLLTLCCVKYTQTEIIRALLS